METFFEPYNSKSCCLCGSANSLTGEHKIKASALRKIFGKDAMVIGHFDGKGIARFAQGPKSRVFHFSARMCSGCNGAQTQASDREFDEFHAQVSSVLSEGRDPSSAFNSPRYALGTDEYLRVFRYFSKLLCCHVAESRGPRPLDVCAFALGKTTQNVVFLHIDADPTYLTHRPVLGEHKFAAHGGLVVPYDSKTHCPTGFRSSLSLGAVRYIFWVKFEPNVGSELKKHHHEFWSKCEAAYFDALENPLSDEERRRIGI